MWLSQLAYETDDERKVDDILSKFRLKKRLLGSNGPITRLAAAKGQFHRRGGARRDLRHVCRYRSSEDRGLVHGLSGSHCYPNVLHEGFAGAVDSVMGDILRLLSQAAAPTNSRSSLPGTVWAARWQISQRCARWRQTSERPPFTPSADHEPAVRTSSTPTRRNLATARSGLSAATTSSRPSRRASRATSATSDSILQCPRPARPSKREPVAVERRQRSQSHPDRLEDISGLSMFNLPDA